MKKLLLLCMVIGFGISEVLTIDAIVDPGTWISPESLIVSDNQYGMPGGNRDHIILGISDPTDTSSVLDSVKVFLEQYVSDSTRASWYVTPIINGNPGTPTAQQPGSEIETVLEFDISVDFTGWTDVFLLDIQLTPERIGGGQPPDWYADYLYVNAYSETGILEKKYNIVNALKLNMPTMVKNDLTFNYDCNTLSNVKVNVYNILGENILSKEFNGTNKITLKEVAEFSKGVYYLKVGVGENTATGKFVVVE